MIILFISIFLFVMYNFTQCPTIFHIWANFPLRTKRHLGARCCRVCGKSQLADRGGEMRAIFTHRPGLDGMDNMAHYVHDELEHDQRVEVGIIRIDPNTRKPFKPRIVG